MSADDKAAAAWDDYIDQQQEEKIEQLERELNAANDRIKRLEDRIHRAAIAFFRDGSDASVASGMLAILEEERGKP